MSKATINDFSFTFTANVYEVKKAFSKRLIQSIFREASQKRTGNQVVVAVREEHTLDDVNFKYSCMYFRYEAHPPFLPSINIKNTLHGFIALIEIGQYVFVFKDSISNISKVIDGYLDKLEFVELCTINNSSSGTYESITTSPMNLSSVAIRSKKFEASDLEQSMPMLSSSRQIPRNFKRRTETDALSVTPSSSRVSSSKKRSEFDDIALWAIGVERELEREHLLDSFMSSFAKPVSYPLMRDKLIPTGVFLRLSDLEDDIGNWTLYWECKKRSDEAPRRFELKEWHLDRLFKTAKETLIVEKKGDGFIATKDNLTLFNVKMNKKSISASGRFLKHIICKTDNGEFSLAKYVLLKRLLQVAFEDHTFQYCNGALFKDSRITNDVDGFLRSFQTFDTLITTSSEKGLSEITNESTKFPEGSLFDFVEGELAENDNYIVCDDLGTEWADHIGINTGDGGNPSISFYVSKHKKDVGTGASQFHDVIGQALKNIGIINISVDEFEKRAAEKWSQVYRTDRKVTKIDRVRKGDEFLVKSLKQVLAYPNTVRNMVIVVDFISKSQLQGILQDMVEEKNVPANCVQLFWILASFISVCREMNVSPIIVCQP
ncbi:hypothetical protein [Maridesulfovibrio sp.]|uniref:hypothetical protein n=1 Tax=Maridesulfovibrio sp. TaxID=2795000 RepID=UPI0039EE32F7